MPLPWYANAVISESISGVLACEGINPRVPAHVIVAQCSTYDHVIVVCKVHKDEGPYAPAPEIIYSLPINDELFFEFTEIRKTVEIHLGRKVEDPIYLHFSEKANFWRFVAAARYTKVFHLDRADQLKALHEEVLGKVAVYIQVGNAMGDPSEKNSSTA